MAPVPYQFYSRFEYLVVQESEENALEKEEVQKFLTLGPIGSYRCCVAWNTAHTQPFYLTEAPCVAKKWTVKEFKDGCMVLQRNLGTTLMLVKPVDTAIPVIIQVNLEQKAVKVRVECMTFSGAVISESMEDPESFTWQDLAHKLFLLKKEQFHYVKFVNGDGELVPRSCYGLSVTSPLPKLPKKNDDPVAAFPESEPKRRKVM